MVTKTSYNLHETYCNRIKCGLFYSLTLLRWCYSSATKCPHMEQPGILKGNPLYYYVFIICPNNRTEYISYWGYVQSQKWEALLILYREFSHQLPKSFLDAYPQLFCVIRGNINDKMKAIHNEAKIGKGSESESIEMMSEGTWSSYHHCYGTLGMNRDVSSRLSIEHKPQLTLISPWETKEWPILRSVCSEGCWVRISFWVHPALMMVSSPD